MKYSNFLEGSNFLFSTNAIIIYAILLVIILVILVIMIMKNVSKSENNVIKFSDSITPKDSFLEKDSKKKNQDRFPNLIQIDKNNQNGQYYRDDYVKTNLKEFCENFRNFAANDRRLYYDIIDIRRFIAGLAVSKIIILQGMSGTGKTSLAYAFGCFIDNLSTVIPIQPMWKERTDLLGYYNEFTKKFNETLLLEKIYEAKYSQSLYITVLDEVNIARVEYYFAEFLSQLEVPDENNRYLGVISEVTKKDPINLAGGRVLLPTNMWFIGTANNDDSTFAISDKVYDRAMIMNLDYKSKPFSAPKTKKMPMSIDHFNELVNNALNEYSISNRNLMRIRALDEYMIKHFRITFGNRIMKQINTYVPIYVACGGDEIEAIDDILAKKVLRKLESQNPMNIKEEIKGFVNFLEEQFGEGKMPICTEFMYRLEKNA